MTDENPDSRLMRFLKHPFGARKPAVASGETGKQGAEPTGSSNGASAPKQRKERSPFYLAALLGGFSLFGAALLATGFQTTEGAIRDRQKEDLLASLALVIPASIHDNDLIADSYAMPLSGSITREVFPATRDGTVTGVAYEVTGQGYGGAIDILMGIDRDGTLLGVRVLHHSETPGLGDKVEATKSDWIDTFAGTSLDSVPDDEWAVKKDGGRFDQFSGATITPRAVVKAVHQGLVFFRAHRNTLLDPRKEKS